MKVLINTKGCGIFLTKDVINELIKEEGWKPQKAQYGNDRFLIETNDKLLIDDEEEIYINPHMELKLRTDSTLLNVITKLGEEKSTYKYKEKYIFFKPKIIEIPDDINWYIDSKYNDHGDSEFIAEEHRTWR